MTNELEQTQTEEQSTTLVSPKGIRLPNEDWQLFEFPKKAVVPKGVWKLPDGTTIDTRNQDPF